MLTLQQKKLKDQSGMTLIEVLAVVVILGIITSIATIAILGVIEKSRSQAMVANAITLRDAARYYVSEKIVRTEDYTDKISYKTLYDEGFIEIIRDPDTKKELDPTKNTSYAKMNGREVIAICFKGEKRNLCTKDGAEAAIPMNELTIDRIAENK